MKPLFSALLASSLALLAPFAPAAESPYAASADIAEFCEPFRTKHNLPALAAVVIEGNRIIAHSFTGVRKLGSPEKITPDDLFHLGSDSKAMTATVIARLIEAGKLKWTTTVGEIFGETVKGIHADWQPVTVRDLLTHHGGAPGAPSPELRQQMQRREGSPTEQRLALVRGTLAQPPVAAPGSRYLYSNIGYAIVGAMVEKILQRPWEEIIRDELFTPLGITSAGFGAPGKPGSLEQPWGHHKKREPVPPGPNSDNPPGVAPAGTAHMTMADWSRFVSLHLQASSHNPQRAVRLLSAKSFDWLHLPAPDPKMLYGCGWIVARHPLAKGSRKDDSGFILAHDGTNTMWYCTVIVAPERNHAFLVASNLGGADAQKGCAATAQALMARYLEK
ncbi:MAG: serine hydrolase domain-containing protein [Verrucomicrobiota bacterium]